MTGREKRTIEDQVEHLLESQAGWAKPEDLDRDFVLMDSPLSFDSLDMIELVMGLEEEFEMEIPDAEVLGDWKTVQDVIDYITKRKEEESCQK